MLLNTQVYSADTKNFRPRLRARAAVVLLAVAGFVLSGVASSAQAAPADGAGYKDFRYTDFNSARVDRVDAVAGNETAGPTSEKPQSKLWFADGAWWGVLFNPAAAGDGEFQIHRYDSATHTWKTTGVLVDARNDSRADALWDGATNSLFIASSGPKSADVVKDDANKGFFTRYAYDPAKDTYTRSAPVAITDGGAESIVLERDTTGKLWVTFTRNQSVRINHSTDATGRAWVGPYKLPVPGADTLRADDVSSMVAFDKKIGVMWSNQTDNTVRFAVHDDANASDLAWREGPPPINRPNGADDHINLKSLQAVNGKVYAAIKTSADQAADATPETPLNLLLVRSADGSVQEHVFGRVADKHTRPIVLIDAQNNELHMFAAAPTAGGTADGGTIYVKKTPLANIQFEPGRGTPYVRSSADTSINDPTSTKQNLSAATDLLVLASDRDTDHYLHNFTDLPEPPNTAPTVTSPRPANGSRTFDTTPRIQATVKDSQTELGKANIKLFVDNRQVALSKFSYDAATDRLAYNSGRLAAGAHKVRVTATDAEGLAGSATWSFRVARR